LVDETWDPTRIRHWWDLDVAPPFTRKIIEIVDIRTWNVAMTMPLGLFATETGGT